MKNSESWKPSKFVMHKGVLRGSRDPKALNVTSRIGADVVARTYQSALAEHACGRLLDLGCGMVPFYEVYRDCVTDVVCVDWGNTRHKNSHLDRECDLTKPLPFADDQFDTILLSDVLEHIPEPELLWQEMARILKPGGKLLLNVPFLYPIHESPHDYYRYTRFALQRFANTAGLDLLRLEPLGGAPQVLATILAKNITRVPLVGNLAAWLSQAVAVWFVRTWIGRKISANTGVAFPIGYFLVAQKPITGNATETIAADVQTA